MFAAVVVPLVVSVATLHVGEPTECYRVVVVVAAAATAAVDSLGPSKSAPDEDMTVVVGSFAIAVEDVGWKTVPDESVPKRFSEMRPGSN